MAISYRDGAKAAAIAEAAAERAREAGDETGELLARVGAAYHRMFFSTDPDVDELERLARTALPLLEQAGEPRRPRARLAMRSATGSRTPAAATRTMRRHRSRHSATPASPDSATRSLFGLEAALAFGPRPADEALRTLDPLLPENPHPRLLLTAPAADHARPLRRGSRIAHEAGERYRELTGDDRVDCYSRPDRGHRRPPRGRGRAPPPLLRPSSRPAACAPTSPPTRRCWAARSAS